ncbi:MAG TPA: hypothetical protein VGH37_16370 [Candidatus Acidoferrum sp.]
MVFQITGNPFRLPGKNKDNAETQRGAEIRSAEGRLQKEGFLRSEPAKCAGFLVEMTG